MSTRAEQRRRPRELHRTVVAETTDYVHKHVRRFRGLFLNRATRRSIRFGGHGVDPQNSETWRQR